MGQSGGASVVCEWLREPSRAGVPCVGEWLPAGLTGVPTCAVEVADRVVDSREVAE